MTHHKGVLTVAAFIAGMAMATSAHAVLIADGITYNLTEAATANPLVDRWTLQISGINAAADTEGGRSGVNAIAFTKPVDFTTAAMVSPPTGFNFILGGLNSNGCDGNGNFFCFDNTAIPPTPSTAFASNSTLSFIFDVTTSTAQPNDFTPAFKIDWVGSKNNYDLVSLDLPPGGGITPPPPPPPPPPPVPEPGALAILGTGLMMLGGLLWRRRSA